ncbi:AI-2E family transporter [Ectobacillus sp. JY-23]|uniref:AI-2E family transporter n=1 Tax=Ectobacillus sp. JY-23 TaxID=2933872 RepID=UPI001FF202F7|nr:AI-2E family transporter [Ectobacillus sp. JY-23]UOY94110.1 AI-2E family transporter [Ectobacillus sp. JY-23]
MKNIKLIWIYRLALLLLLFLCLLVFWKLRPMWFPLLQLMKLVIIPFLTAYFIAYLLHPLVEKLHQRGMPRVLAILLIYILFFGGVGYGVYKGVPAAISQLKDMNRNFPQFINMYESWTKQVETRTANFPEFVTDKLREAFLGVEAKLQSFLDRMMSTAQGILDSLLIIVLIPFIVFYLLKDYDRMYHFFWRCVPGKWCAEGRKLVDDIDKSLGNYIRGQLFVCAVLAGVAAFAFWIIGLKYPLLLGILIGVTDIIPYFGPILGAIPTLIVAATVSVNMVIKAGVALAILQFLESNILSPYIVGKSLRMHPVVIMFALLVGGEIAGLPGLLLAVPVLAVLRTIIIHSKRLLARR